MTSSDLEPKEWGTPNETLQTEEVSPESSVASSTRKATLIAAAIALVILAVFLYWLIFRDSGAAAPPQPLEAKEEVTDPIVAAVTEIKSNEAVAIRPTIVPFTVSLQASDEPVRQKADGLSTHAQFAKQLAEGDLIRRFVAVCKSIAMGESPAKLLDSLTPKRDMKILRLKGRIYIDTVSYRRYDNLIVLLLSLNAEECAELYLSFEPQIEQAYRELGQGSEAFVEVLKEAVKQLRQTPIPPDRVELLEKTISYAYADPELEGLNLAQKHFMRLGPDNLRQLQGKIGLMLDSLLKRK